MTDELRLSDGARSGLVNELAGLWRVVHGGGPGCLTGFAMMGDEELVREVERYRGRARAARDRERE